MKKFIVSILLFSFIFILIGFIVSMIFAYRYKITSRDIPALNISNSYSFNEKALFLSKASKEANTLAIGSSMTLNNLHSITLIKKLGNDKFLNTASWGMSIIDDFNLLKSLNNVYKIKTLIISSTLIDFKQTEKKIDYYFFESYIQNRSLDLMTCVFKNFDFKYYFINFQYAHKVRTCFHDYEYLNYDNYGTVNFNKDGFNVKESRWENDLLESPGSKNQYIYLDSISSFCKNNGIELLFFQSPLRHGLYSKLSQLKINNLKSHIAKVKSIIEKKNNIFIDSNEKTWSDSLFVDAIHFNEEGAQLYTEYCFDKIKARKQKGYK